MKHVLTPIAGLLPCIHAGASADTNGNGEQYTDAGLDLFFREEVGGSLTRATAPVSANVSPTISAVNCHWPVAVSVPLDRNFAIHGDDIRYPDTSSVALEAQNVGLTWRVQ